VTDWAVLTGEYPPQPGGVSDYARLVARGLAAAGDRVRVYAPAPTGETVEAGVEVHRLPGRFGPRALLQLEQMLFARQRPDRILVQYVPNAYGWKAMNIAFATWLATRVPRAIPVWVMFHEVVTPFVWRPMQHTALAVVTRAMARLIAGAADRVFVSIPAWGDLLRRICPRVRSPEWLPVPCTLEDEVATGAESAAALRTQYAADGRQLVGHFGTYGRHIATQLAATLEVLLQHDPNVSALLTGRGSAEFANQFVTLRPELTGRAIGVGPLAGASVVAHLKACDLLVQPFQDGISTRRTSAMVGLACGMPIATNLGALSEPVWSGAVAAVPDPDPAALARLSASLLADPVERAILAARAAALYRDRFALRHTVAYLRESRP